MTSDPKPSPRTNTAAMKAGHVGATDTAAQPTATRPVAAMTDQRAVALSIDRIVISTPSRAPAKCTLMVAPATGRLTPKRRVRCSSSGPYAATTRPMSRKVPPTETIAVRSMAIRSTRSVRDSAVRLHCHSVPRRRDWPVQQWIAGFTHPPPQSVAQLTLNAGNLRTAGKVALLQRIGLEVIQLDHAWPVGRVPAWVRPEDRAELDVGRDLDRERRLEVADELVPMRPDAAHRVVVAVERLLGEDSLSSLPQEGLTLDARRNGHAARLEKGGQHIDVADQLRVRRTAADVAGRPADQQRHLQSWVVERALGAWHRQAV